MMDSCSCVSCVLLPVGLWTMSQWRSPSLSDIQSHSPWSKAQESVSTPTPTPTHTQTHTGDGLAPQVNQWGVRAPDWLGHNTVSPLEVHKTNTHWPGSSLASSAVAPSSMSNSHTWLWLGCLGTATKTHTYTHFKRAVLFDTAVDAVEECRHNFLQLCDKLWMNPEVPSKTSVMRSHWTLTPTTSKDNINCRQDSTLCAYVRVCVCTHCEHLLAVSVSPHWSSCLMWLLTWRWCCSLC